MRRQISVFAVWIGLCSAVLTACSPSGGGSATAQQKLSGSFSANLTLEMDDFTAEGTLTRYDTGIWSMYFDSPSEIAGVVLDFSGDDVTASYKGLSFSVPQAAMPSKALLLQCITAIDTLAKSPDVTGSAKDDLIQIEGELETGPYELCLNKDGSLSSFQMDQMGACITFRDFQTDIQQTTVVTTIASLVITTSGETVTETQVQ